MATRSVHMDWNKFRFSWKKQVNRSPDVPSGAKNFASFACDEWVNRKSGQFFHGNRTLAKDMGVNLRTIQRHIKALMTLGYLVKVRVRGRRRTLQLSLPHEAPPGKHDIEHDTKHDRPKSCSMTRMSSQGDRVVVPYTNQGYNQKEASVQSFKYELVAESDTYVIEPWKDWLLQQGQEDPDEFLQELKTKKGYMLPCKFPEGKDGQKDRILHQVKVLKEICLQDRKKARKA